MAVIQQLKSGILANVRSSPAPVTALPCRIVASRRSLAPTQPQSQAWAAVQHASNVRPCVWRLQALMTADGGTTAQSLTGDSYICLGLSHCFQKSEADGKLVDCFQIEPISASSLECMATGARTSFKLVTGVKLSQATARSKEGLPQEFADAVFCDKWDYRVEAAARTWQRPHAMDNLMDIVPLGKVRGSFNFSLDDKRIINFDNVVTDDDNIKQDISIDVYGREKKEVVDVSGAQPAAAVAEEPVAEPEEEEDDLEALLMA